MIRQTNRRIFYALLLLGLVACRPPTEAPPEHIEPQSLHQDLKQDRQQGLQNVPLRLAPLARPDMSGFGVVVSIPLPRGQVQEPGQVRILGPDGKALRVTRRTRLNWPDHPDKESGPRIVEVIIAERVGPLLSSTLALDISEQPVPDDSISVPSPLRAAAILPPRWNLAAHLFSRSLPAPASGHWFDRSMYRFAATAINRLPPSVDKRHYIDFSRPAPWLFDRAGLLFQLYFRNGDIQWFTAAEKASRRYEASITRDGFFALKPGDLKYVYARPLLYRWMLFGESHQVEHIRAMARAAAEWPADGRNAGFWTERHANYALATAVHAWELTGDDDYRHRIQALLDGLLAMSQAPLEDGRPAQCPAHPLRAHEGNDDDQPVCSPWMMALLGQTLDYYYQLSGDPRALELLVRFHQYLMEDALYRVPAEGPNAKLHDMLLPWYLASRGYGFSDNGPYGDLEHSCDAAGLLARTGYYRARRGDLPADHETLLRDLMESCRFNLEMWHRTRSHDKPQWRLSPPRKFNWWFGSTQDLTWLLRHSGG